MTEEKQSGLSAREVAAEYAAGTAFDVDECAREPIHLLGSVQSHGALLALAEPELTVAVASSNTAAVLGVAARGAAWLAGSRHSRPRTGGAASPGSVRR